MAPTENEQNHLAARKWPDINPFLVSSINTTMRHDDALQLCFVEWNNRSNQSEDHTRTGNEPMPSCVSTENGTRQQSPDRNNLLQKMHPQTEPLQRHEFTFELPDTQQPLFLTADIANEQGVGATVSYNAVAISLDNEFALVALEINDKFIPTICHVVTFSLNHRIQR